ncbi:O-antigen ligase family protein [Tahibacter sp.]|uniref:O-antigen ligase family protein n=1 Tax=Tahibacter sp. TaxID=2056211 RepID=UPI0028C3D357|nr:O-antigen ligase family protein [Tahibacter sp.]
MSNSSLSDRLAHLFPVALLPLWALLLLLPLGRSAEFGVVLCLAGSIAVLWRDPQAWPSRARWQLFALLWACYAGAALLSAVDAVNLSKSWGTVLAALRLLPLGLYALLVAHTMERHAALQRSVALILTLWLLDAWVQALTGWSLAGAPEAERLSGVFGSDNLKLGPVLATLSPFLLFVARERWGQRGLVVAFVFVLVPVLLAGSRASWFALGLVALALLWRETRRPLRFAAAVSALALVLAAAGFIAARSSDAFGARVQRTLQALDGSPNEVDFALAGRAQIWQTSVEMIQAHPVNGVGVRGFRYAYAQYAGSGDSFVQADGSGAAHAHQWVLEVLSETGVLGLLLWFIGIGAALRAWWCAASAQRAAAAAPGLALVAMAFPLNTHLAFYSAWWGLLFWWLIAQFCAALASAQTDEVAAHA